MKDPEQKAEVTGFHILNATGVEEGNKNYETNCMEYGF